MTTLDAYKTFIIKMNESATSRGMAVNKGKFVVLFNRNYLKVVNKYLQNKSTDEVDKIRGLLKSGEVLNHTTSSENSADFKLPDNYLEYDNFRTLASTKEGCSDFISIFPVKGRDIQQVLTDEYNKPSFFAREAPFRVTSDGVKIYTDNFKIDRVELDYYKEPKKIRVMDEYDPESKIIEDTFEVSDVVIEQVISLVVVEYSTSNEDFQKAQAESNNI